jgi:peroxiredoxin Q/BCP
MKAYQDGIAKLTDSDAQVFGISIDTLTRNRNFADSLKLSYPLLSDLDLNVSKAYGVLNPSSQMASRATFVIDKQGVIQHIEEGGGAIDPTGAITMCSTLKKKETSTP